MSEVTSIDARLVDEASDWTTRLIEARSRGRGDLDNATRRVAAEVGVSHWKLWALRGTTRRPKVVAASIWMKLKQAYTAECAAQARRYEHERQITEAKTWAGRNLLGSADLVADQDASAVGEE